MAGFVHKLRNVLLVDSGGWRAVFGAGVIQSLTAASVAFAKSLAHGKDGFVFDWSLFGWIVSAIVAVNVLSNVVTTLFRGGHLLHLVHGRKFRRERKQMSAAVLKAISLELSQAPTSGRRACELIVQVLDCVASHVRDARGSHDLRKPEVFANLLVEDGNELVVVARDTDLHSSDHARRVPERYGRANMLATRSIGARRALSVGDVSRDYPEGPKNKPYRSILTIPVIGRDPEKVLGIVSVDSSRPYFFQSFQQGVTENELENDLLPYLATLALIMEGLVSDDPRAIVEELIRGAESWQKGS